MRRINKFVYVFLTTYINTIFDYFCCNDISTILDTV